MDLRSGDPALEAAFLQIAGVELDVVREDAPMTLVGLADEDLLHATRIILLTLWHQSLAELVECVLGVFVWRRQLHSLRNALLAVATHGDSVLTLALLLLASVNGLIGAVLLLLVLHLQIVLLVWIDLRVGARTHGYVYATPFDSAGAARDVQLPLHLPLVAVVAGVLSVGEAALRKILADGAEAVASDPLRLPRQRSRDGHRVL